MFILSVTLGIFLTNSYKSVTFLKCILFFFICFCLLYLYDTWNRYIEQVQRACCWEEKKYGKERGVKYIGVT